MARKDVCDMGHKIRDGGGSLSTRRKNQAPLHGHFILLSTYLGRHTSRIKVSGIQPEIEVLGLVAALVTPQNLQIPMHKTGFASLYNINDYFIQAVLQDLKELPNSRA